MDRGRLLYLIGASGAGKDSLLRFVAARADPCVVTVARRFITRPANAGGEDHIAISQADYQRMLGCGQFSMHWGGNGLHYGIPQDLDTWLARGRIVLVNGSRGYLAQATARYPLLYPVLIRVSEAVLRKRLLKRRRESPANIEQRIARARQFGEVAHPRLQVIDNDGPLEVAGEALLRLIGAARGAAPIISGSSVPME
ncbi:ribose 1,5-bisphosphokinase [Natronocella acetinitrilica]|uniref:Ribose 1,5-bisphosphate phosphokinase PhnN n=1 Tax=Natronocella acetinitrilica TaxID=414046 RepID=A0AAE3G6Q7_9GAMM|nr:phosphonate metabolism protein/1,5-bisphosphokinase (PRPP-forming) PhnN [Natronocella acetinitrilica]MCP1676442.1 ribose 1,5-bisphosphokinase [Natronocella acetinitrilica]